MNTATKHADWYYIIRYYRLMQDQFDKKILIHQNLCLVNKITELRVEITQLQTQIDLIKNVCQPNNQNESLKSQIQKFKNENTLLKQRITLLNNYQTGSIQQVISHQQNLCFCGGLKLKYYSQKYEEKLQNFMKTATVKIEHQKPQYAEIQSKNYQPTTQNYSQCMIQNKILKEMISKLQKKVAQCRLNHRFSYSTIMNSSVYNQLKNQCKNLLYFCSQSITKQRNLQAFIQKIEQQRKKQVIQLLKKFQFHPQELKCQDFILKSQLLKKLDATQEKIKQLIVSIKDLKRKVKQFTYNYDISYDRDNRLTEKLLEGNSHQRSIIRNFHNMIGEWIEDQSSAKYFKFKNMQVEATKRHWTEYKQRINSICEQNESIKKQIYQQQELLDQKKQSKYIHRYLKQYQQLMYQLQKRFETIREQLLMAEFRLGKANTEVFFKYRKQLNKRIGLEQSLETLKQKMPLYFNLVNQSENLNNIIQIQKLQMKEKQGKYLSQIAFMKGQLQQKSKLMAHYQELYMKKYEQMNKLKIQYEKLAHNKKLTGESQYSQNQIRLQLEVNQLLKKINCTCGRGNQASVILNCKHIFCKACVQSLVKGRKRECPLCRQKFSQSNILHFMYN